MFSIGSVVLLGFLWFFVGLWCSGLGFMYSLCWTVWDVLGSLVMELVRG